MKKFAVVLSCGIFTALLCVPSFALVDSEPLDSSYVIHDDISVLSAPPIQTLAAGTEKVLHGGIMPGTGNYFSYYTLKGLSDTVLQDAFNDNARETSNELYDLSVEVNSLKSSVSSALNQGQFEASMDKYWEFFDWPYLKQDGSIGTSEGKRMYPNDWLRQGLMGLASKMGLGFPSGSSLFTGQGIGFESNYVVYSGRGSERKQVGANLYSILSLIYEGLYQVNWNGQDGAWLSRYGTVWEDTGGISLGLLTNHGLLGLASILRGDLAGLSGSLVNSSDLSSASYFSNNILGAYKPLFDIQNDLARLTHVIADPTEQALHDATKDNVQSVTDNLTGEKGVTSQDIGDLSGISSGVGDFMSTGVSPDRLTGSISDEGNYSFFSQQTADDLHTFPAPQSVDDDFIDFYAINRQEYSSLLGGDFDG